MHELTVTRLSKVGSLELRKLAGSYGVPPWFRASNGKQTWLKSATIRERILEDAEKHGRWDFLDGLIDRALDTPASPATEPQDIAEPEEMQTIPQGNLLLAGIEELVKQAVREHGIDPDKLKALVDKRLEERKPRALAITVNNGEPVKIEVAHEALTPTIEKIEALWNRGQYANIWLAGPAGSGKTTLLRNLIHATHKIQ